MKTSKGSSRSFVWDYFIKSEDKMYAKCLKCSKTIKLCGNTTNLSNHLKKHIKDTAELNFLDVPDKPKIKRTPPVGEHIEFVDLSENPVNEEESVEVYDEDSYIVTTLATEEVEINDAPPKLMKLEINEIICRICLSNDTNDYIIEYTEHDMQPEVINSCTGIEINECSTLPNTICYTCVNAVRAAYQLRLTAQESDRILKEQDHRVFVQQESIPEITKLENFDYFKSEHISTFPMMKSFSPVKKIEVAELADVMKNATANQQAEAMKIVVDQEAEVPKKVIKIERATGVQKMMVSIPKKKRRTSESNVFEDYFEDKPLNNWRIYDETNKATSARSTPKGDTTKRKLVRDDTLKSTMKRKYSPARKICEICAKECRGTRFLMEHMNTHSNARPYKCDLCPMRFNSNNSKMRHLRTHTKQKPYQCNLCPNTYRASHHLKYHKIQKHGTEADKKFRCSICGKAFAFNFILNAHMKDHCKGGKKQTTFIEDEIAMFDVDTYISS